MSWNEIMRNMNQAWLNKVKIQFRWVCLCKGSVDITFKVRLNLIVLSVNVHIFKNLYILQYINALSNKSKCVYTVIHCIWGLLMLWQFAFGPCILPLFLYQFPGNHWQSNRNGGQNNYLITTEAMTWCRRERYTIN